jgi:hypothetical protein
VLLEADGDVDAVGPAVHVVHAGQISLGKAPCSSWHCSHNRMIVEADSPADEPRNCSNAGTKTPGRQVRRGDRLRSPVSSSMRLSLTRGARTTNRYPSSSYLVD